MRPPITIAEGLDVCLYRSGEEAALAVEGPDVLEGIYRAYDAEGRRLRLQSAGGPRDYSALVTIELSDAAPTPSELESLLREYLAALGKPQSAELDLAQLIEVAVAEVGYCR